MDKYKNVNEYIKNSWIKSIRKKDNRKDYPLPYDFIPPCIDGALTDLYYWDTYFTNKGLYLDGFSKYAYYNIENLKYCLKDYGYVPNMCRASVGASQPPLLFMMVKDYYNYSGDLNFLMDSYNALQLEYNFWMTERIAPNGLNKYGSLKINEEKYIRFFKWYAGRVGLKVEDFTKDEIINFVFKFIGEGESGEDHTPRFNCCANQTVAIDLNSYLYGFERAMAEFSVILGLHEQQEWIKRAESRLQLLKTYCYDKESGLYFDYNYIDDKKTYRYCVACYMPYVFGFSTDLDALKKLDEKLVFNNGVVSCEKVEMDGVFQWGYPNAWAPHNYYAVLAHKNVGLNEQAKTIALNFLNNVADEFSKSGKLYEKYDAIVGGKAVVDEYGTPEMLGWTAGVFQVLNNEYFDLLK